MSAAVEVSKLNKVFRVWKRSRDMVIETITGRNRHTEFQALRDISFEVAPGSVVGLLGRNGAGKSTLLRILAGTLDATSGHVAVHGRISAILELGTGFHPDYTGRENVFLGALCLGLKRSDIEQRFDEIVDFAELWDFIDQPFRTYSSGMRARLTFSVATCVDPDVLIVDEALSVGDARFALKSFGRLREFKQRGKSILLVSHNINQIVAMCDRAILLEKGSIMADGDPNQVGNLYHELLFGPAGGAERKAAEMRGLEQIPSAGPATAAANEATGEGRPAARPPSREMRYGLRRLEIVDVRVEDARGAVVRTLHSLERYWLVCKVQAKDNLEDVHFGFLLRDPSGFEIFGWDTWSASAGPLKAFEAGEEREVKVGFKANLGPGTFFLSTSLAHSDQTKQDFRFDVYEVYVRADRVHTNSLTNLEVDLSDLSLVPPEVPG